MNRIYGPDKTPTERLWEILYWDAMSDLPDQFVDHRVERILELIDEAGLMVVDKEPLTSTP